MAHYIKYQRAKKLSAIGVHHRSYDAMWDRLPASAKDGRTAAELAEVVDGLWFACQSAKEIAAREIIETGAVWDSKRDRAIELAA